MKMKTIGLLFYLLTTLTFAIHVHAEEGKELKTPILKVEEFDQAVDFFEALGFERTSTQENIRTKLYVTFENVKYMIRFDIWPLLDDVTFVTNPT